MCAAKSDVRFTPNSDRKSGFPQKVMSALPPKADIGGMAIDSRLCLLPERRGLIRRQRIHTGNKSPPCGGSGLHPVVGACVLFCAVAFRSPPLLFG
jgi:hypothetical protein